ncbi:hypothetical protein [Helicobacter fennelliae]|uniref:Uncharacterized protein n=1 Tax=Helicobacter fennelliae MRY12-0050 TaxID=1325130 RepID=T1DX20_9HELI|nr:hypothetical protein [Helicobacter fennelliae]GAD20148.1 hypothetical protein HFN_1392 [Helicobacter fennelliae MRY12-0050]STP07392.1 Uncharacterised protein [Helicobacter fennelliae]STQ92028.1 Uncharacterised protein [Helicobacter fennelliae]
MKENEIESYEIENDIRYDEEFRSFLKKVLGVLWTLCIVGIFVGGDLEGSKGLLSYFVNLTLLPITTIPIWFIFGKWKFVAIPLSISLFLASMALAGAIPDNKYIVVGVMILSLIGITGTLLIALIRAVWSLIKKRK